MHQLSIFVTMGVSFELYLSWLSIVVIDIQIDVQPMNSDLQKKVTKHLYLFSLQVQKKKTAWEEKSLSKKSRIFWARAQS